jgi:uncharacterized RDD family membrane protein YckC
MAHAAPVSPVASMDVHVTGRRILAVIVDSIVIAVPTVILSALLGTTSSGGGEASVSVEGFAALLVMLISVVIFFAYYTIMEGYLGQTVGKMLLGIKVVREDDGAVPGLGAAAIRTVMRIIDGIGTYLVGFIAVLVSSKNQRLGDMVAHTLVVRK